VVGWRGRGGGGSGVSDDAACYVLVPILPQPQNKESNSERATNKSVI